MSFFIRGLALAVFLGTLPTAPVLGQDTLAVGDTRVDGSHLGSYSVVWRGTNFGADGRAGTTFAVEEEYEVLGSGPEALFKMTQVWNDTLGEVLFVTVRTARHLTLEYYSFHTGQAPGGIAHLDFEGGRVAGMYAPAPEQRLIRFALKLDEPPFASMAGILATGLPLQEGARFVYPRFGWGGTTNPELDWTEIHVVGRAEVDVPGRGVMRAWKVESGTVTYWVSREAPYFLKAESIRSNGGRTVFEIERWSPTSSTESPGSQ